MKGWGFRMILLSLVSQASVGGVAEASPCERALKATGAVAKFMFYPLVAPIQATRQVVKEINTTPRRVWSFPFRYAWRDKGYLAGLLTIALAIDGTYVSGLEFVQRTESLLPKDRNAPIVLVDAFGSKLDWMKLGIPYMEQLGYPGYTNVHVIYPRNTDELVAELKRIRFAVGPIALMDFASHGRPGQTMVAGTPLDPSAIEPLTDVFAPDASIRLFNCLTGSGCGAREYLEKIGTTFLPKGGRVVASQKYVAPGVTDVALAIGQKLFAAGEPLPPWLVRASKVAQSPWMLPYAAFEGVTQGRGWTEFFYQEFEKLDFLHVEIPRN